MYRLLVAVALLSSPLVEASGPCNYAYQFYNNRCFRFFYGKLLSWNNAEADCASRGGHLASIHNQDENQWMASQMSGKVWLYWIGMATIMPNSPNFTWSDNSQIDYQNWNPGVPGICTDGGQNAVYTDVASTQWFNCWPSSTAMGYVCEIPWSVSL